MLPIIAAAFVVAAALLVSVAVWATKLQNAQPAKEREQSHILFTQESEPSEAPVSMPAVIEEESEVSELPESSIVSEVEIPTTVYGDPIILDASISASSSLDTDTYGTANLKDFDATTAWAEGVSGNGTGETLTFTFDEECNVYGIALMPGYFKSADLYKANAAPLELEVSGGDFRTVVDLRGFEADFSNLNNDFKYIDFATPVHTSSLKVTITDVRDGSRYDDMSISELHFYTYSSTPEGAITGTPSIAGPTYEEPEEEEEEEPQEEEEKEPETVSGDYILPESNTRYLTTSDLKGLTKAQCRLARNEIYARHGRGFDDPELQAYFNGKSWYTCTISASEWSSRGYESTLNDYEAANRDLIVQYENSL